MTTGFPTSIDSYTTKTNNVDTINASHVNDLQDAMVAVQTAVGTGSVTRTSWTPTITWEGGTTSVVTYTSANTGGWYTQIGKAVIFVARIEVTAITYAGTPTNVNVSLPVTALAGNFNLAACPVSTATGWTTLYPAVGRVVPNTATMRLYAYASGTGNAVITNSNTGSPSGGTPLVLMISGSYFVT